ncbi:MAG: hypothetical protein N2556_01720 [Anaerolineae bacterium]|nr:hypothetical protein [Anaerolineae bacterium]
MTGQVTVTFKVTVTFWFFGGEMTEELSPHDDARHPLQPGQHEAFYFAFTASDGTVFGLLRTLFGHDSVLEILVLQAGGATWFHHSTAGLQEQTSGLNASGPMLQMHCRRPWEAWNCAFSGPVQDEFGRRTDLFLQLEFVATTLPGRYTFGPYTQAQQDGRLYGRIQVGELDQSGEWLCYRDHSWGVRPMGVALGWTVAWVPERLYAARVETPQGPAGFGRFLTVDGVTRPLRLPEVTAVSDGWRVEEREAGLEPWTFARMAGPLVGYLGPAGHEAFRPAPQPGDLLRDELGPARFTSPEGEPFTGFLEQARRIP